MFADDKMMHNSTMGALQKAELLVGRNGSNGRSLRYINKNQAEFLLQQIAQPMAQMQIRRPTSMHSPFTPINCCCASSSVGDAPHTLLTPTTDHHQQQSHATTNESVSTIRVMEADDDGEGGQQQKRITFRQFLSRVLSLCPNRALLHPLVDRVFARYVHQIVRKGFLLCRRLHCLPWLFTPFRCCLLPANATPADRVVLLNRHRRSRSSLCRPPASRWRLFWCILQPGQLHLWPLQTKSRSSSRKKNGGIDAKLLRQWQQQQALDYADDDNMQTKKRRSKSSVDQQQRKGHKWTLWLQSDTQIEVG